MKTACIDCKYRHDYYKKKLTKKEAFCRISGKLVKSKKNCIHREGK
jgi:hypothetical protein